MDGTLSELLTEEQRKKFRLVEEALDRRGIFRRFRVEDQSIFDALFVAKLIERPQHEAARCFSDILEKSGVYPASLNIDVVVRTPSHCVGDMLGSKWLTYSRAFRFMVKHAGEEGADNLMRVMAHAYCWRSLGRRDFKEIAALVSKPLWTLADYFRCRGLRDPRKVARSFPKKKAGEDT
tara:strand:+ start:5084 stop:5620 length:537 start_codon:yes stop_codon:yes gene_type:complete